MNRIVVAVVGVLAGVVAVVAGVLIVFGAGWALIVAGVLCASVSALLVDVEESDGESSPASP